MWDEDLIGNGNSRIIENNLQKNGKIIPVARVKKSLEI